MPYGTGRIKKVNLSINPEIFAQYKAKCREMGISPSEGFEMWMKSVNDSDGMMRTFETVFQALVKAEAAKNK